MDGRQTYEGALRLLKKLLDSMTSSIDSEKANIHLALVRNRDEIKSLEGERRELSIKTRRFGWVPVLGKDYKAKLDTLSGRLEESQQAYRAKKRMVGNLTSLREASNTAIGIVKKSYKMSRGVENFPPSIDGEVEAFASKVKFQDDKLHARSREELSALADKLFPLVKEGMMLARSIEESRYIRGGNIFLRGEVKQQPGVNKDPLGDDAPGKYMSPVTKPAQLSLDLGDGSAPKAFSEKDIIWLPVTSSRTRELQNMGANVASSSKYRGSRLWIPNTEEYKKKFDKYLPLSYREKVTPFSFPPIRHNAAGQNLWSLFDKESWNHIRSTTYDRAGHRCMICGKQGGKMWNKLAPEQDRDKGGPVDCHEVWEWQNLGNGLGIQKLKQLLIVCKDCHFMFHERFAVSLAEKADVDVEKVERYIENMRTITNRCDVDTLNLQLDYDDAAWEECKDVSEWIVDLSNLSSQDYMNDQTMVFNDDNKAKMSPQQIAGIAFTTTNGESYPAQDAREIAYQLIGQAPTMD